MKQLIILSLFFMTYLAGKADEISYTYTYTESDYNLITSIIDGIEYTELSHDRMAYENINGLYDLPASVNIFSIPLNATNVEVSVIASNRKLIESDCILKPHQDAEETSNSMNYTVSEKTVPQSSFPHANILNQGFYDGDNRVVSISVCPFEYNCVTKQLYIYLYCTLEIKYDNNVSNADSQLNFAPISRHNTGIGINRAKAIERDELTKNNILNLINSTERKAGTSAVSLTKYDSTLRAHEYLIISSKNLINSFKRLATMRMLQGYDVGIVAIEDILANESLGDKDIISGIKDDAGKLRTYLIYAYEHWGTKYVLLGGDSDIIPIRYGTAGNGDQTKSHNYDDKSIPSDLYYSDLNSNWNTDNRSDFYGKEKDQLDYYPELYVGRLLCKNAEDVDNYIDKLEVYEMRPGNGDPSYLLSVTETYQESFQHQKSLINCQFDKFGYTYNDTFIGGNTEPVAGSSVISSINNNMCGIFTHHGHANPRSLHTTHDNTGFYHNIYALDWQKNKSSENYEDEGNGFNNLVNRNKPFIMQSVGCITSPIDHYNPYYYPDSCNLAQSFTLGKDYGGVAFLGNSRPGYYYPYSTNNPSRDKRTIYMMQSFWNVISKGAQTIGEAEALCKSPVHSPYLDNGYSHEIRLAHHLIGDPLMKIWTSVPKSDKLADIADLRDYIDKNYHILANKLSAPICYEINVSEIANQQNCTIYYMPKSDNRLPLFTDLTISSMDFKASNILYCETLCLGTQNSQVRFSGDANVTFRCFGSVSLDNIIIEDNAVVTIVTSGDVNLNKINVSSTGHLRIRCNKCFSNSIKSSIGIEIYEYDAEGKRFLPTKSNTHAAQMVVEGRSWEYIDESSYGNYVVLQNFMLRIEGEATVDGQQYAVVNAYVADQPNPAQNTPYCYLRETANGKVYARTNPDYDYMSGHIDYFGESQFLKDGSEFLLVDFHDFYASQTFYPEWVYEGARIPVESYRYTNAQNTLEVWQLADSELRLVESVGYVWPNHACGLLTPVYRQPACEYEYYLWGLLYLQQVRDADGSVVYEIENKYSSVIPATTDNTPAVYYDLQGHRLNVGALRPGIYIRQQGGTVSKVLIK